MKKLITHAVFLAVFAITATYAQTSPELKSFIPASPNAAALAKYGEIPVSLYTGIPNISIPLTTLKGRSLDVPVSLSYHAGGIRVEEIASWVGSGWSLNAGGAITRSVRGMPDDGVGGYFGAYVNITAMAQKYLTFRDPNAGLLVAGNAQQEDLDRLILAQGQILDAEPDIFYFSFGKYTGKFFMNQNGQFVATPLQALKISYNLGQVNSGRASRWTVTTPDGVKYIFGNSVDGRSTAIENNSNGAPYGAATTAWYLVEIDSPDNDVIKLNYSNVNYSYTQRSGETITEEIAEDGGGAGAPVGKQDNFVTNNMSAPRLTSIQSATGTLTFTPGSNRQDLPGEASLAKINIFSNDDMVNPVRQWIFNYNYSTARLTLINLSEQTPSGLNAGTYSFEYNGILPDNSPAGLNINSQDLWGYNNGSLNTVFPQGAVVEMPSGTTMTIPGADRHSDENAMKVGTLTKITYPTGGYSQFDYEANRVYTSVADNTIPPQPAGRGASITWQPGKSATQTFTITYPDPTSHTVAAAITLHGMRPCTSYVNPNPNYNSNYVPYPECFSGSLVGVNGTDFTLYQLKDGLTNLSLPPGTYQINGSAPLIMPDTTNDFHLDIHWIEFPPAPPVEDEMANKLVGGLRIQRITNFDGVTTSIKRYVYDEFAEPGISSGVLVNTPSNYLNVTRLFVFDADGAGGRSSDYVHVRSYPLIPLMPTQGGPIGYANVTELEGENGENGKTEYSYTNAEEFPDEIRAYAPYPPACSYDWRRGLLLTQTTYRNVEGDFLPVQSKSNVYTNSVNQTFAYGYSVECDIQVQSSGGAEISQANHTAYYVAGYKTASEFYYLSGDETVYYDEQNPDVTITTSNSYSYDVDNGHYQLISTDTRDSKNQEVVTNYYYPPDIVLTGDPELARQSLVSKFILTPVLEKQTLINGNSTFDTKNIYHIQDNGLTMPLAVVLKVGTNDPEARLLFTDYDNFGNLVSQRKVNDLNNSYIWDYHSTYPIAEVKNADATDIAYTSFEADGTGNWVKSGTGIVTGGVTGTKAYDLGSGSITTQNNLNTDKNYIITVWAQTMPSVANASFLRKGRTYNGFTYYEFKTNDGPSSVTVSGSGLIDELRLYPTDAQMSTYTYRPLFGIASHADVSSKIAYYEYDGLGRVQLIRDQDNNIVKRFEYQYQQH